MSKIKNNVYLVGFMGSGKTTIGRRLATVLKSQFIDTDQLLEQRTGVSVSHIFELEGEQGFRDREERILCEIAEKNHQVIATGGGTVLRPQNLELMDDSGIIVYLHVSPEMLWDRLKDCKQRPLLQTENPQSKMQELMALRDPIYRERARIVVPIDSNHAQNTAADIANRLGVELKEVLG